MTSYSLLSVTGVPGSVLRRLPTGTRVRGQPRGQIRQLPQNARNLISAARRSSRMYLFVILPYKNIIYVSEPRSKCHSEVSF